MKTMYNPRKDPYPHRRDSNFLVGGGLRKLPSVRGIWVFSGSTQHNYMVYNRSDDQLLAKALNKRKYY